MEETKPMKPLNGEKTHPLSAKALKVLDLIRRGPIPTQEINPGTVDRLLREGVVKLVELPSPYKSRKGNIQHLQVDES